MAPLQITTRFQSTPEEVDIDDDDTSGDMAWQLFDDVKKHSCINQLQGIINGPPVLHAIAGLKYFARDLVLWSAPIALYKFEDCAFTELRHCGIGIV